MSEKITDKVKPLMEQVKKGSAASDLQNMATAYKEGSKSIADFAGVVRRVARAGFVAEGADAKLLGSIMSGVFEDWGKNVGEQAFENMDELLNLFADIEGLFIPTDQVAEALKVKRKAWQAWCGFLGEGRPTVDWATGFPDRMQAMTILSRAIADIREQMPKVVDESLQESWKNIVALHRKPLEDAATSDCNQLSAVLKKRIEDIKQTTEGLRDGAWHSTLKAGATFAQVQKVASKKGGSSAWTSTSSRRTCRLRTTSSRTTRRRTHFITRRSIRRSWPGPRLC